jgi:hypothetical protein
MATPNFGSRLPPLNVKRKKKMRKIMKRELKEIIHHSNFRRTSNLKAFLNS